jgi:hypothetical protein
MGYNSVYGVGPLDNREPLYHSEPFWIEMNRHPLHDGILGSFVNNVSQVCLDIGMTTVDQMRIATRFGKFDYYAMAACNVSDVIQ